MEKTNTISVLDIDEYKGYINSSNREFNEYSSAAKYTYKDDKSRLRNIENQIASGKVENEALLQEKKELEWNIAGLKQEEKRIKSFRVGYNDFIKTLEKDNKSLNEIDHKLNLVLKIIKNQTIPERYRNIENIIDYINRIKEANNTSIETIKLICQFDLNK